MNLPIFSFLWTPIPLMGWRTQRICESSTNLAADDGEPLKLNLDDIYAHSKLQAQIQTTICLDERINNARHALTAVELRGCRIINIKLGRVGGRVEQTCRTPAIPVWCGGMLETGIGRAHNILMSRGTIRVPKTPGIGGSRCVETIAAASGRRPRVVHERTCLKPRNKAAMALGVAVIPSYVHPLTEGAGGHAEN
jgi:hypothetical protein